VVVVGPALSDPGPIRRLEEERQAVRRGLVRAEDPKVPAALVQPHDVPEEAAEDAGRFRDCGAGCRDVDGVGPEVGHLQILE
jgi:hypothetical protein